MMNYKDIFFLIIVFLTQTFQGVSQGISSVDSLKNKLVDYSEDTTSIKIMEQIFNEYYYSNLDSAKQYYNKILFVSEKLNFEKGTNTGYYLASKYFWKKGDLDSSLFNIEKCEAYAIKYNDNLYLCDIYLKMANIYTYIGNIDDKNKSKQLLNKAFQMGEKLKDDGVVCHALQMMGNFYYEERDYKNAILNYLKIDSILTHKKVVNTLLATTLSNVGFIYTYLKNYDKAEKYFVKTRDLYIDLGNVEGVAYSNFSMGTLFLEKDDYELAINHFHQALDFYIDYGDFGLTLETYSNLGLAYVMINNLEEAQKYYNSALELSVKIDRNIEVAKMYFGVGNLYKIKKSYKEALKAYQKALDIYNNLGQYSLMERAEVYDGISDLYSNIGDFKKAYEYRVIYEHLNDSLHFKENNEVANEIEEKYQNEKKEREIASLNEKNILIGKQKESQSILYLSVFCFLLILVLTFYLLYKSNRKGKEHLKKVDDLKSRFITNISHEFRTPLTMINGIVEKNYSQDNSGVFSNLDMISVKNNVGSLLELVDQLLELARVESGDLKLSVSSIDVFRILNDFVPSFQLWAEKKDIQFNWKIPVYSKIVWVDPDVLHKVVINILSNAFKYTPQYGTVTFEAKIEKDTLYIEVTNSG
ncbi:MAG: tetratricopeptide repeat-containing sensor histidine kinase, partial [Cyclobacteriaceae bacterium]|nr:tetratricopeptide repeat-containing sensor histidine kinase [Cyclobacteriaceae bacterium]